MDENIQIIGYLDVLGFRRKVTDNSKFMFQKYCLLVDRMKEYKYSTDGVQSQFTVSGDHIGSTSVNISDSNSDVHCFFNSDTIVYFSTKITNNSLGFLMCLVQRFISETFLNNIPLRGAIDIGELFYNQNKNVFLGDAIIKSYDLSNKQNWLGTSFTERAINTIKSENELSSLFKGFRNVGLIVDHPVPCKDGLRDLSCINWLVEPTIAYMDLELFTDKFFLPGCRPQNIDDHIGAIINNSWEFKEDMVRKFPPPHPSTI